MRRNGEVGQSWQLGPLGYVRVLLVEPVSLETLFDLYAISQLVELLNQSGSTSSRERITELVDETDQPLALDSPPERLMITNFSHADRERERQEQRRKEVMAVLRGPHVSESERKLQVSALRSQFSLFCSEILDKQNKLDNVSLKK